MKTLNQIKNKIMKAGRLVSAGQDEEALRHIIEAREWINERQRATTKHVVQLNELTGEPERFLREGYVDMMRSQHPELIADAEVVLEGAG